MARREAKSLLPPAPSGAPCGPCPHSGRPSGTGWAVRAIRQPYRLRAPPRRPVKQQGLLDAVVGEYTQDFARGPPLLGQLPGRREVERLGEVGMAFVVPRPGAATSAEGVIAWCREWMANYKVPRAVEIVDSLPLNAAGKVEKRELRARAARVQRTAH